MAINLPVPQSGEGIMRFHRKNPDAISEAFHRLNLLGNGEVRVVAATTANQGRRPLVFSETNLAIPIPVGFTNKVAQPNSYAGGTAGGAYVQADMQAVMDNLAAANAKIIELTQALTAAGLNPP